MISKNKIKYIRSLEMKKYRKADCVFVAEGKKLVGDLIGSFDLTYVAATAAWLSDNALLLSSAVFQGVEVDEVSEEELRRVSFQETPQQVLAIFRQRQSDADINEVAANDLCLVLDDVQNPGNMGTIVRIADWFGIRHIFCSDASADIYNPKTVQATMGGMARVEVHYANLPLLLDSLDSSIPVYGTFLDGDDIHGQQLSSHGVIIMGNEGRGVSAPVSAHVSHRLFIPNYPPGSSTSESLNVAIATAIVCNEFRRPR